MDIHQTLLDYQRRTSEFTLPFEQCSLETQKERLKNMNTTSSNTQAKLNYNKASDDILDLLESMGFITEYPVDVNKLRIDLSDIIKRNVEGNTIYNHEDK